MKVTLVIAAVCIVASLAGKGDKIDHFVAPIPEKCVKRKCFYLFFGCKISFYPYFSLRIKPVV